MGQPIDLVMLRDWDQAGYITNIKYLDFFFQARRCVISRCCVHSMTHPALAITLPYGKCSA